ncbi:hypothetical protein BWI17_18015 [Betaproteobacteria bacterium GR16-43]|nr:hypothetical protein BWI17_18015 [Betaproteobacteria bacterium GR16-43]
MLNVESLLPGRLRVPAEALGAAAAPVAAPQAVEEVHAAMAAQPDGAVRILRVLTQATDPGGALAAEPRISIGARTALALGLPPGETPRGLALDPMVLMIDAPGAASSIAEELAGRIVHSGLFYESHLADFAEGTRPRAQVAAEPQARHGEGHRIGLFSQPGEAREKASSADGRGYPLMNSTTPDSEGSGRTASADPAAGLVPAPLEPVVREQLAALERNEARFAIPIGQARPAELVIGREETRGADGTVEGPWTTRLRLDLPNLGEVHARIRLSGRAVSLEVEAGDAPSAELLAEAGRVLRDRLSALDLHVTRLEVQSNA